MSLHPQTPGPVPEQTARVAKAAFPKEHPYLLMRNEFGTFFHDEAFAFLFPRKGQPAEAPWRLAVVTLLQFAEGLSDRQAADAVRSRLDWKYLLSLLAEFRPRLVKGEAERLLLETLLTHFRARGLLRERGRQRTDTTHVLAAVRGLNRLETIGETMRAALNSLSVVAPHWMREHAAPEWSERYDPRFELARLPKERPEREALAEVIGADGRALLETVLAEAGAGSPWRGLKEVPAREGLRQVWGQQFFWKAMPSPEGTVPAPERASFLAFRADTDLPPPSQVINSPYDAHARLGRKRGLGWVGYKGHFTETCAPDLLRLIMDVQTTHAPCPEAQVLPEIHWNLARQQVLPEKHLTDSGYIDAALLHQCQEQYQVQLCGPTRPNVT
ncbi:MAG: IS5/IS1182 family transposase [Chloroflexota bacterium]